MTPSRESTFDRRFRRIYGAIVGVIALLGLLLVYSGFAEIKTRIYDVDALLTGDPQATPDDRFEQLQTRLRTRLDDDDIVFFPRRTPPLIVRARWSGHRRVERELAALADLADLNGR